MTVNCSAVVETLFESELFGHVRGAFTGATEHKPGLFELADGGTLFLDEIGELPQSVQAKLLRVLELGEVHRVGSLEARRVNVHVIAATNRDLRAEVAARPVPQRPRTTGSTSSKCGCPPLRDRREDIPYLTAAFVRAYERAAAEAGRRPDARRRAPAGRGARGMATSASCATSSSARAFSSTAISSPSASWRSACRWRCRRPGRSGAGRRRRQPPGRWQPDLLATVERDHIQRALVRAGGNKKAAAKMLGLSRRALTAGWSGSISPKPSRAAVTRW